MDDFEVGSYAKLKNSNVVGKIVALIPEKNKVQINLLELGNDGYFYPTDRKQTWYKSQLVNVRDLHELLKIAMNLPIQRSNSRPRSGSSRMPRSGSPRMPRSGSPRRPRSGSPRMPRSGSPRRSRLMDV